MRGGGSVAVYDGVDAWRRARLHAEMEALRGDAFRRLGTAELRELILRRDGGRAAVAYDADRACAALDPQHPGVARVLAEGAEDASRVYVLLAAVLGAVNCALERITDEDEAAACAALLEHLAANPRLLERD